MARILIVDDEEMDRLLLAEVLQEAGHELLFAPDGHQALKLWRNSSIDLVVTDIVMPDLSGPELARHLRPFFPKMKVLYITGYTDSVIARHGLDEASVDILQKPFTIGSLTSKVRQLLSA